MFMEQDQRERFGRMRRLSLLRKLRLAWRLRRDERVSLVTKLPLILVLAYLLTPINVLPRWLPLVRRFHNLIVAAAGLWLFVKLVPPDLLEEHLSRVEKRPRVIETTVAGRR